VSDGGTPTTSRIMLVRHGRSAHVSEERWIDAAGVHRWRDAYDAAGIDGSSEPPVTLLNEAARADVVIASDLARAIASAERLAGGREVRVSPLLRESMLDIPTWLPARWPLTVWAIAIHIQWLARVARRIPINPAEKQRVSAAVDWLENVMHEHRHVVVVTHGVFRGRLGVELVARGWTAERRISGYQHWSVWAYAR
jgi:broad specificity phosphatase PhoE